MKTSETVPARRYLTTVDDNGDESTDEFDTVIAAESSDGEVDLHISPRTDDVVTVSLAVDDAWRLLRNLARAITEVEDQ